MVRKATAMAASHLDGSKLYHERARIVLPILVRQAKAMQPIFYSDLAKEVGMSNPRTLNYPLGSIGRSLTALADELDIEIPMIQSLVINKNNQLPGDGIGGFIMKSKDKYRRLPKQQRRELFKALYLDVYAFDKWDLVLSKLGLKPVYNDVESLVKASKGAAGNGEGVEHKRLKNYIYRNPEIINATNLLSRAKEKDLASGDRLDVSFESAKSWIAVEVKSKVSGEFDLTRGVFQVIKYEAVMAAELAAFGRRLDVDVVLVIESEPVHKISALANTLAVKIIWVQREGSHYIVL